MTRTMWLAVALFSLVAGQAAAAEFPPNFRGLWLAGGSCGAVTGYTLFASDFGVTGVLKANGDGKFVVFGFGGDVIVDAASDRMVVHYPFPDAAGSDLVRELRDGKINAHLSSKPDTVTTGFRCDTVDTGDARARPLLRVLHRLDRFVRAYSDVADQCRPDADVKTCAARIVAMFDLNGDGKIAPAEATTFLRHYLPATLLFGGGDKDMILRQGYRGVTIDPDDLAAVEAATMVFGPFLTNILFSNFDFDGNGFLTVDEVALAVKEEGLPDGAGGAIRLLSQSREQAEEAFGALGGMAGGMLGGKPDKPH